MSCILRWGLFKLQEVVKLKTIASFCGWAGLFESYQVANPEDRFSSDEAHILVCYELILSSANQFQL